MNHACIGLIHQASFNRDLDNEQFQCLPYALGLLYLTSFKAKRANKKKIYYSHLRHYHKTAPKYTPTCTKPELAICSAIRYFSFKFHISSHGSYILSEQRRSLPFHFFATLTIKLRQKDSKADPNRSNQSHQSYQI